MHGATMKILRTNILRINCAPRWFHLPTIEYLSTSAKLCKFPGQMPYELYYLSEMCSDFDMKIHKYQASST